MSAFAAEDYRRPQFSAEFDICMEKSGGVTVDARACANAELKRQDQRLNKAYAQLGKAADDGVKAKMKDAQRGWIQFRDAECVLRGEIEEGTLRELVVDSCHLRFTEQRANELDQLGERLGRKLGGNG